MLAAVGLYGVLSYSVSRRQREIGIRLALGAQTSAVRALVVREGAVLAVAGVTVGLAGALAATRALGTLLFGVSARDPLTFALAGASPSSRSRSSPAGCRRAPPRGSIRCRRCATETVVMSTHGPPSALCYDCRLLRAGIGRLSRP